MVRGQSRAGANDNSAKSGFLCTGAVKAIRPSLQISSAPPPLLIYSADYTMKTGAKRWRTVINTVNCLPYTSFMLCCNLDVMSAMAQSVFADLTMKTFGKTCNKTKKNL